MRGLPNNAPPGKHCAVMNAFPAHSETARTLHHLNEATKILNYLYYKNVIDGDGLPLGSFPNLYPGLVNNLVP